MTGGDASGEGAAPGGRGSAPSGRERAADAVLWGLVLAAGAFVLLPAVVQLLEARQAEDQLAGQEERTAQELEEQTREIQFLVHDPQTQEKLSERYPSEGRN